MEELKPCPFCGGRAKVIEAINIAGKKVYAIYCRDCYIANNQLIPDGETFYWDGNPDELQVSDGRQALFYGEINKAVEHWNTRQERTCNIEEAEFEFIGSDDHKKGIARCYVCSECQDMIEQDANYCPNCGAKVVEDE